MPHGSRVFFGRLFGDGLLAYIIYAFLFVGVFNSATNTLQIGREFLICISPNQNPNRHLVRFIGIVAFSIICLIQLFSSRAGRSLNSIFALIKILFLLVLLGFGFAAIRHNTSPVEFTQKVSGIPALNYAQAILIVLFSYTGWENANFVSTTPVSGTHSANWSELVCHIGCRRDFYQQPKNFKERFHLGCSCCWYTVHGSECCFCES